MSDESKADSQEHLIQLIGARFDFAKPTLDAFAFVRKTLMEAAEAINKYNKAHPELPVDESHMAVVWMKLREIKDTACNAYIEPYARKAAGKM